MARRLLVPEIGLPDTRRGRRWLAIFRVVADHGGSQEQGEAAAWSLLAVLDACARRTPEARHAAAVDEIRRALGGDARAVDELATAVERAHRQTR